MKISQGGGSSPFTPVANPAGGLANNPWLEVHYGKINYRRSPFGFSPFLFYGHRITAMSKKKRSTIYGPFVPMMKDMLNSKAYKELRNSSRVSYLLLRLQCKHFEQSEVKFPVSHAAEYMDRQTFMTAITQLIDLGFIQKTFEGGLYRRTSIYRFVDTWRGASVGRPPYMDNSIRGREIPTVKKRGDVANKWGNPHHKTIKQCSDGREILPTHGREIHT